MTIRELIERFDPEMAKRLEGYATLEKARRAGRIKKYEAEGVTAVIGMIRTSEKVVREEVA